MNPKQTTSRRNHPRSTEQACGTGLRSPLELAVMVLLLVACVVSAAFLTFDLMDSATRMAVGTLAADPDPSTSNVELIESPFSVVSVILSVIGILAVIVALTRGLVLWMSSRQPLPTRRASIFDR